MSSTMFSQYTDIEDTSVAIPTAVVPKPTFDRAFDPIVDAYKLRNVSMERWGEWIAGILWAHWLGLNR